MRKILIPAGFVITTAVLWWVGGFDFNERGGTAVLCLYTLIVAAFLGHKLEWSTRSG